MISLAVGSLLIGYTLIYAAVAAGGTYSPSPFHAWKQNASAYDLAAAIKDDPTLATPLQGYATVGSRPATNPIPGAPVAPR